MLSDDDVLLLRIVHPAWMEDSTLSSLVFRPSRGEPISVFDGSMITPEDAFHRFSKDHVAYGVVGVSVGEVLGLGITIEEDREPYPEHTSLVFPDCTKREERKLSGELRDCALSRGWLYKND